MPTLNINGNILTDTEANWTLDATVYSAKTILVSTDAQWTGTDQNKYKLANGIDTWSNLDYVPFTPDAITASSTDTLTNKTFDANGTGNSLSNVDVSDLANGTDGELITWDATGAPTTVSTGTSGQVLTSNGAGAAPTFQDAAGGGVTYAMYWGTLLFNPADSTRYWLCPSDQIAPSTGTNGNRRHKLQANTSTFYLHIGLTTGGSTESATWVIRNHTQSTEANFSPGHSFTSGGQANAYRGSAILSCNQDDYVELILDTPAWTTNPTSVRASCTVTYQAE